ncbi:ATPase [Citrobacter freundii]|nr:ATPase [Citrobacter freundii]WFW13936.1 ATPase [Citrobacter freundii]
MSETSTLPVAENQLSKKENNTVQISHESCDIYYCTENQELLFLTTAAAKNLDEHASEIMTAVDEFHQANEGYSKAVEEFGVLNSKIEESAALPDKESNISNQEANLTGKRDALRKVIGKFESEGAGYDDVVELIPISRKNGGAGTKKRYAFAKKGYVDNLGAGVRHKVKFKQSDADSILKRENGNITGISVAKLKKQIKDLEFENKGVNLFDPIDKKLIDETLTGWAESWNNSLVSHKEIGQFIDFSAGAQFMRCTSNLAASAEWDPSTGELAIKGEFKATLSLASGIVETTFYLPDRVGWSLTFQPENRTEPLKMGMLRVYLKTSLIGFVGASAQAEAQLQITTYGGKQMIMGNSAGRLPRFSERHVNGATFHKAREENEDGAKVSAEAFGGARAELKLAGGVQWLQPPELTVRQGKTGDDAKEANEFADFCTFTESLVGMAGAGIGGTFQCDFVNGKFCFKIAASLCVGLGAKGSFEAEVDFDKFYEFSKWLIYQLYGLDYAFFEIMAQKAFEAFTQVSVLLLSDMEESIAKGLRSSQETLITIGKEFNSLVNSIESAFDESERRNQLATKIINNPDLILMRTPEAKGILLYLLTHHGTSDHFDFDNRGDYFIDIYQERKQAIIVVLQSIQTQREWFQIFSRFNTSGSGMAEGNSALKYMVAQNSMNAVRRFLQEGFDKDREMDLIYKRLRTTPAWGYALTMNNTTAYRLTTADNPFYPRMGTFSPLSGANSEEWS